MRSRILSCALCVFVVSFHAPAQIGARSRVLREKELKFVHYEEDFLEFARGDEYEPSFDMQTAASEASEHVNSARALFEIYENLSCGQDRAATQAVINRQLSLYISETELEVKAANLAIAHTKKPGIAAEATQMREELRDLETLFKSISVE